MKYTSSYTLQLGLGRVHTHYVAYLWETKNCNGMLQNRRIVMAFFRNDKVIIVQIQLTLNLINNEVILGQRISRLTLYL